MCVPCPNFVHCLLLGTKLWLGCAKGKLGVRKHKALVQEPQDAQPLVP